MVDKVLILGQVFKNGDFDGFTRYEIKNTLNPKITFLACGLLVCVCVCVCVSVIA